MASCVRNVCTKNYQNLIIGFPVTVKNVGDVFFETQCILLELFALSNCQCLTVYPVMLKKPDKEKESISEERMLYIKHCYDELVQKKRAYFLFCLMC